MDRLEEAESLLHKYYGYKALKPIQRKAIQSILHGEDTFVVMPTGGGKSLCYQIPALMLDGLTLVISPLISLMKDQVDQLVRRGIRAACMNSMLDGEQYRFLRQQIQNKQIQILYVGSGAASFRRFFIPAASSEHCVGCGG